MHRSQPAPRGSVHPLLSLLLLALVVLVVLWWAEIVPPVVGAVAFWAFMVIPALFETRWSGNPRVRAAKVASASTCLMGFFLFLLQDGESAGPAWFLSVILCVSGALSFAFFSLVIGPQGSDESA